MESKILKHLLSKDGLYWMMFYSIKVLKIERLIPTGMYLKIQFRCLTGRRLNLKSPQTFNEKLQWLKINNQNELYTTLVDKYNVKKYIEEQLGKEYVIENYGVWDSFDEIDFKELPEQFVLKCTHDSGGLVVCKDKASLDIQKAKEKIEKSLKRNYYYASREWPYKKVPHRVIAERYLEDENGELRDYKFFCFNGEPQFLYVSNNLATHQNVKMSFLNLDWSLAPFQGIDYPLFGVLPEKPVCYAKMLEISRVLSKDIPFVRVDLYEYNNHVYFSEMTFFHSGGFMVFNDEKWNYKLGELIQLPNKGTNCKHKNNE